nr:hypothetical protein [Kibdelosporangium sp. MJ126-NF4]
MVPLRGFVRLVGRRGTIRVARADLVRRMLWVVRQADLLDRLVLRTAVVVARVVCPLGLLTVVVGGRLVCLRGRLVLPIVVVGGRLVCLRGRLVLPVVVGGRVVRLQDKQAQPTAVVHVPVVVCLRARRTVVAGGREVCPQGRLVPPTPRVVRPGVRPMRPLALRRTTPQGACLPVTPEAVRSQQMLKVVRRLADVRRARPWAALRAGRHRGSRGCVRATCPWAIHLRLASKAVRPQADRCRATHRSAARSHQAQVSLECRTKDRVSAREAVASPSMRTATHRGTPKASATVRRKANPQDQTAKDAPKAHSLVVDRCTTVRPTSSTGSSRCRTSSHPTAARTSKASHRTSRASSR